jgi:hypothetical protein
VNNVWAFRSFPAALECVRGINDELSWPPPPLPPAKDDVPDSCARFGVNHMKARVQSSQAIRSARP